MSKVASNAKSWELQARVVWKEEPPSYWREKWDVDEKIVYMKMQKEVNQNNLHHKEEKMKKLFYIKF